MKLNDQWVISFTHYRHLRKLVFLDWTHLALKLNTHPAQKPLSTFFFLFIFFLFFLNHPVGTTSSKSFPTSIFKLFNKEKKKNEHSHTHTWKIYKVRTFRQYCVIQGGYFLLGMCLISLSDLRKRRGLIFFLWVLWSSFFFFFFAMILNMEGFAVPHNLKQNYCIMHQ